MCYCTHMVSNKAGRQRGIKMNNFKVTQIQFFDTSYDLQVSETETQLIERYSANIVINDTFMIQYSGGHGESNTYTFPTSDEESWNDDDAQDAAEESYNFDEIVAQIESAGFLNSFEYLKANSNTI